LPQDGFTFYLRGDRAMLLPMNDLKNLTERVVAFRDARDWKQFHKPKDMALSLALEAAEVLEVFQWKSESEIDSALPELRERLGEELSDVLYWVLLLAHDAQIDLRAAFERKMEKNETKYPTALAKGSNKKYSEL
jgi:NTP pyrophosphatase (non-canonical NTP hydrolase)